MSEIYLGHEISAYKLAGQCDGKYYAFIDGLLDYDIRPSQYPAVVINRIKAAYAMQFIFDKRIKA